MAQCLIGLGSNLGDRTAQLNQAAELLCGHPQIQCEGRSAHHTTRPVGGPPGQDWFLNAAIRITTQLPPQQLLAAARAVEQQMGRKRRERWGPREIDIDILLYEQEVLVTADLIVPHPRMAVRRFVLEPAREVAADMLHPRIGWTVAELLQRLTTPPYYVAIVGINPRQTLNLAQAAAEIAGVRPLLDPLLAVAELPEDTSQDELVAREERVIARRRDQLLGLWTGSPKTGSPNTASQKSASQKSACQASPQDWYVSNYWLPQSMAVARAWLQGAARQQVEQACELAVRQVPLPHCVIFLDTVPDHPGAAASGAAASGAAASGADRPGAQALSRTRDALLMRELAHQAACRGQGPVVHVPGGNLQLAITELTAAIDAMR
ncbi:MAG: 2-amino-4-hydroxy-6-hydroxymethyldihydropteridine diphosphokinase [Pirellulaceae bacterium]